MTAKTKTAKYARLTRFANGIYWKPEDMVIKITKGRMSLKSKHKTAKAKYDKRLWHILIDTLNGAMMYSDWLEENK